MKKTNMYLILAIGFFIIGIGNFYMDGFTSMPRILLNIGWLVIAGLYFV